MANDNNKLIEFRNFSNACDVNNIDNEDIPFDKLKECTNLTPFRKAGALVPVAGMSLATGALSSLPTPSEYELIDFYTFSIDRDNKEINLLVYECTTVGADLGAIKLYINPYYNPAVVYSNNNPNKTAATWISEWLELTEYISLSSVTGSGNNFTSTDANLNTNSGYYKGFFVYNTTTRIVQYNNIREHTYATGTHTFKCYGSCSDYSNDSIKLFRFPVLYFYNADINSTVNENTVFKGKPTDFIYKENQLRMPCGKELRPLILDMIYKRDYFEGGLYGGTEITSISMTNMGSGYDSVPAITFNPTGATADSIMGIEGSVSHLVWTPTNDVNYKEVESAFDAYRIRPFLVRYDGANWIVVDSGEYTDIPSTVGIDVQLLGGTSPTPGEVITVASWKVVRAVITNGGNYTAKPTVTFSNPTSGTTATGVANVGELTPTEMKYDGFWFDFQQIPQILSQTAVTGFSSIFSPTASGVYITTDGDLTTNLPTNGIEIKSRSVSTQFFIGKGTEAQMAHWAAKAGLINMQVGITNKVYFWNNNGLASSILGIYFISPELGTYNITSILALLNASLPMYSCTYTLVGTGSAVFFFEYASSEAYYKGIIVGSNQFYGTEAGGRSTVKNKFLGSTVIAVPSPTTFSSVPVTMFIFSALIDNRNEVMIAQGTLYSGYGLVYRVNLWFSRRLTGFNFYNKVLDGIDSHTELTPIIVTTNKYPYFVWKAYYGTSNTNRTFPNEIPHHFYISVNKFDKAINGEQTLGVLSGVNSYDPKNGVSSYTYDNSNGDFFAKLGIVNSTGATGQGLKWIANTNRFIDQDITMNYTKATFVGQTNGRYFVIGCKNSVEDPEFENDDMVFYNHYAVGVSEYDVFLRTNNLNVALGDKDVNRAITNYRGYLTVIKDSNIYGIDVNTDDDIRYRVVDTMVGRGISDSNAICHTPYGIVVCSNDGVYLVNPNDLQLIMNGFNANLQTYKADYAVKTNIQVVFYKEYNELLVSISTSDTSHRIYIYNFQAQAWTIIKHLKTAGIYIKKIKTNSNNDILIMQQNGNKANFTKVSETAYYFIDIDKANVSILFTVETHNLPIAGRPYLLRDNWFSMSCSGYKDSANAIIQLTRTKDNAVISAITAGSITSATDNDYLWDTLLPVEQNASLYKIKLTNNQTIRDFTLHAFYLWITIEPKFKITV